MKPLLALAGLLLVTGCGSAPEPAAATQEQACTQAEEVTDAYRDGLGDAASAEDARAVIDGAITGLRDIQAGSPVAARIDDVADALSGLLEGVEAGTPPAELRPRAEAIGTTTTALSQACGRSAQ
jgi:hypothetical protein